MGLGLVQHVSVMDYLDISIYVMCVDALDVSSTNVKHEYLKRKHPWQLVWCVKMTQFSVSMWDCHSMVLVCGVL